MRVGALLFRQTLRRLRNQLQWRLEERESAASLNSGEGPKFLEALHAEGLLESARGSVWTITQAGQTLSSATAARRISRATGEKALEEFVRRVERVNSEAYFLGKVTRVFLFGSMLNPEVDRVSDVDLAVEIVEEEGDLDCARRKNYDRVEELSAAGCRFRNVVERAACWHVKVFRFLKGPSRVVALADYAVEKSFVLAAAHRFLIGEPEHIKSQVSALPQKRFKRQPHRVDCPF